MRALVIASLFVLGSAGSAWAGGCPTCTTNQDCVDQGAGVGALCVEWFDDFGCGTQRIACCPGQGCALQNGEPSCVASNSCRRLDTVAADAGPVDQGPADQGPADQSSQDQVGPDAGPADLMPGTEAGPTADSGPVADTGPQPDASAGADSGAAVDSGNGTPDDDEGCGCRSAAAPATSLVWLGAFGLLAVLRRRR